MSTKIFSWLVDKLKWLLNWYLERAATSWKIELHRVRNRDNKFILIGLCIFFAIFLFPYLAKDAFSQNVIFGLSFIWASFLAISFAYILRNPILLILVYVAVAFRGAIKSIFISSEHSLLTGDLIGALILAGVGVMLLIWVNRIGKGDI